MAPDQNTAWLWVFIPQEVPGCLESCLLASSSSVLLVHMILYLFVLMLNRGQTEWLSIAPWGAARIQKGQSYVTSSHSVDFECFLTFLNYNSDPLKVDSWNLEHCEVKKRTKLIKWLTKTCQNIFTRPPLQLSCEITATFLFFSYI